MDMTVRNISPVLRAQLEDQARAEGKSPDELIVEAITLRLSQSQPVTRKRDLSFLAQSGPLEPEVLEILGEFEIAVPSEWE